MTDVKTLAKQLEDATKYLVEHKSEGGCYHFNAERMEDKDIDKNLSIVLGWAEGYDDPEEDTDNYCDDGYRLCVKVGYQDINNVMQCDYAIDFNEPYWKDTGDTCGGEIPLHPCCNFENVAKEILESFQWVKDNWNKLGHE